MVATYNRDECGGQRKKIKESTAAASVVVVCVEEMERQATGSFLWQQLANNKRTNEGSKKKRNKGKTPASQPENIDLPFSCYFFSLSIRTSSRVQAGGWGGCCRAGRASLRPFQPSHRQVHSTATPPTQPYGLVGPQT